jgi:hypothetical protein
MTPKTYPIRRRGTYAFLLASKPGDSFAATCRGDLRKLDPGKSEVNPDATVAAAFTVSDFAGDDKRGPGFYLTLADDATAGLEAGARYLADAIYTVSGEDYVAGSWIIEVHEPATVALP